jgi:hypothetical protein
MAQTNVQEWDMTKVAGVTGSITGPRKPKFS